MSDRAAQQNRLNTEWSTHPRWRGIQRPYSAADVVRLRGTVHIEHSLARLGAEKFWKLLHEEPVVGGLGCVTRQPGRAGRAIRAQGYLLLRLAGRRRRQQRGRDVSGSEPVSRRLRAEDDRAHQQCAAAHGPDPCARRRSQQDIDWLAPIIADAEAGFGGNLNAFELTKAMIRAGAAGVHFEDQLSSAKKCGHMGGKVLVPTDEAINKLVAARLAADVSGVPTIVIARTDAEAANLLTSDHDSRDQPFLTGKRSAEGFFHVKNGIEQAIARGLAYAPYADLIWCETAKPDIEEARRFARGIHARYPGKLLAYNCSPSFNWESKLSATEMRGWRECLAALGYRFQFITLAGWHALNLSMFELASAYRADGMLGYSRLQQREFASEADGYRATRHQAFVGTGYFDAVQTAITSGQFSTGAMQGSTEQAQFHVSRAS